GEGLRVGDVVDVSHGDAHGGHRLLFSGVVVARTGEHHPLGEDPPGREPEGRGHSAQDGAQRHAAERAGFRGGRRVQIGVRVEPDDRELLVVSRSPLDGGHGDAAVAADQDDIVTVIVLGEGLRGECAHANEGAEAVDAGLHRLAGLVGDLDDRAGRARQIACDRLCAVDQLHRTGRGRALPLRNDHEAGHQTIVARRDRIVAPRSEVRRRLPHPARRDYSWPASRAACSGAAVTAEAAPPDFSAASRASTSVSCPMSSRLSNCASSEDAASSCLPWARASCRRTFSSKRPISLVGSRTSIDLTASATLFCASAVLARASSSLRLTFSCSSLVFMPLRPTLSFSTTSVWVAIVGSAAFASFSELIWRWRAIFARLSNLSASAVLPARRSSSALRLAASALPPHSAAAWMSSAWSRSSSRRLPIVSAIADS